MKPFLISIILFAVNAWTCHADNYARQYVLDEQICNKVPVTFDKGSTTLMFPAPPDAIRPGRTFVADASKGNAPVPGNVDFYAVYQPGSRYISIRALTPEARDVVTFIIGGKLYNVELFADKKPVLSAVFYKTQPTPNSDGQFSVTPARGVELIRQAQAFDALNKSHPEAVEQVECFKPQQPMVIPYQGWMVWINRVWRFEQDDTLVFWISFINRSASPLSIDKNSITVVTGDGTNRYYQASVIDSVSVIPPAFVSIGTDGKEKHTPSMVQAWFTVSGDGHGGRNWLKAEDNWNVLVSRKDTPVEKQENPQ